MNTDITASEKPQYPVIDRNPPLTKVVGNFSALDYLRFVTITGVSVTVGYLSGTLYLFALKTRGIENWFEFGKTHLCFALKMEEKWKRFDCGKTRFRYRVKVVLVVVVWKYEFFLGSKQIKKKKIEFGKGPIPIQIEGS